MSFSDDDLKRLKERPWCAHEKHAPRDCGLLASILESDLPALLARLEAAEALIPFARPEVSTHSKEDFLALREAWRKAAGK